MSRTSTRLKTCPWCNARVEIIPWHGGLPTKVLIGCSNDHCHVHPSTTGETLTEAKRQWNRRRGEGVWRAGNHAG